MKRVEQKSKSSKTSLNLEKAGENAVFILRVLIIFFNRALKVKIAVESGKSIEAALGTLKPPAFFKNKINLISAAKKFSSAQLKNIIETFIQLELDEKSKGLRPELLMSYNIISTNL